MASFQCTRSLLLLRSPTTRIRRNPKGLQIFNNHNRILSTITTDTFHKKQHRSISVLTRSLMLQEQNFGYHAINNISNVKNNSCYKRSMVMITTTKAGEPNKSVLVEEKILFDSSSRKVISNEQKLMYITTSCWQRIEQLAKKKQQSLDDIYLRVFVDAGGCSGFTYKFELDTEPIDSDDDIVFTPNNDTTNNNDAAAAVSTANVSIDGSNIPRVVIDQASYELIQGSTIDYVQEMIKSNFEIKNNPQSESACGCGSSFALKNFQNNPALD